MTQGSRPHTNRQADLTQWVKMFYGHIDELGSLAIPTQFNPTRYQQPERSGERERGRGVVPETRVKLEFKN
ncbi:MAG: hypothetical protein WBO24_16565 [Nitrospirales bacterium]